MPLKDHTNKTYGRLTALYHTKTHKERSYWMCSCSCGNTKEVASSYFNHSAKYLIGCGCYQKEKAQETSWKNRKGLFRKKLKDCYNKMISRCYDSTSDRYLNYGGRGITVCRDWLDNFDTFLADVGLPPSKDHQIDRIDVNGNYVKENIRWVTRKENCRNKTNNRLATIDGVTKTLTEWCEIYKVSPALVWCRVGRNWDALEALTTPLDKERSLRSKTTRKTKATIPLEVDY